MYFNSNTECVHAIRGLCWICFFSYCLSVRLTWPKNQTQIIHVRIHLQHKHQTTQLGYDEKHVAELDKKY